MAIKIHTIPILSDNYVFLIECLETHDIAIVDPGSAHEVLSFFENKRIKPSKIFITHKHWDHTDGISEILDVYDCKAYGPAHDEIPLVDMHLHEKDSVSIGNISFEIFETPGHTSGHISYYSSKENTLFCGDTLFSFGCGGVRGGQYKEMYESLKKICALPEDTLVYCSHEYTLKNLAFALSIEPENNFLQSRFEIAQSLREKNLPTIPSVLQDEIRGNPFLRFDDTRIAQNLNMTMKSEFEIFCELRNRKDLF